MTVLHVITGLNVGGAEGMLAKLLAQGELLPGVGAHVLSLLPPGPTAPRIEACGVRVDTLGMREGRPSLSAGRKLRHLGRTTKPSLVQGWMHHGNLAALLAGTGAPVVWNIRHSLSDVAHEKPLTRAILRLCGRLSTRPAAIIYNSATAARQYADHGYDDRRAIVIPNGFDCERYSPNSAARAKIGGLFNVAPHAVAVVMVARLHPMKDHQRLLAAVAAARRRGHDIHLVFAGTGLEAAPVGWREMLHEIPEDRLTFAGQRDDVADWLPGADIVALPSAWGEGFPNVLGEALACGVPCVATDIGDSAHVVGEAGLIVPPADTLALEAAISHLASLGHDARKELGAAGRRRVISRWSIASIARRYADLYASLGVGSASAMLDPAPPASRAA